jgi:hypothetical protein
VTFHTPVGSAAALGIALEQTTAGGAYLASGVSDLAELPARIIARYNVTGLGAVDDIAARSSIGDLGGEIQA